MNDQRRAGSWRQKTAFWASFALQRFFRSYFRLLFGLLKFHKTSVCWKLFNERANQFLGIPYIMLNAPRWNTHALIASAGPLHIADHAMIDLSGIQAACKSWTLAFYKQPANKCHKVVSPLAEGSWTEPFYVSKGDYVIVLRLYEEKYPLELPGIVVDEGRIHISKRVLTARQEYIPEKILHKRGAFYDLIHHYLFYAFKHGSHAADHRIRNEYLPVGNPETIFRFGYLPQYGGIRVQAADNISGSTLMYITFFNKSSFPVFSQKIAMLNNVYRSPPATTEGTYLIRIVPLHRGVSDSSVDRYLSITSFNESS
ncbi:MAG: hypothetical protein INR73_17570 [Williamsia sp.]|nr:hypothetical protein [Williamsia sp.]